MEEYTFELRLTRIPKEVLPTMPWYKRAAAHSANSFLKNQHMGLTKIFANSYKIDRSKLTDEDYNNTVQSIQITGTKEYCEKEKQILEGLDEEQIRNLIPSTTTKNILDKAGKSIKQNSELLKSKGWHSFVNTMATLGIMITLDVFPSKAPLQNINNVKQKGQ